MAEHERSWYVFENHGGAAVAVKCPGCAKWLYRWALDVGADGQLSEDVSCEDNGRTYAIRLVGWPDG